MRVERELFPLPVLVAVGFALALAVIMALAPLAVTAAPPKELGPEERADLGRLESYLNGITTLRSRFLQVSSNGGYAEGHLYLSRPGGMRIEYDPPTPMLIVADDDRLVYFDKELETVTYLDTDDTPAGILIRPHLSFSNDDLTVLDYQHLGGVFEVSMTRTDNPAEGVLTLVFEDDPIRLGHWRIVDAQGVVTRISLMDPVFGVALDKEIFQFDDPRDKSARF